jgi:ribosomal protein S18 acetylase RimI-like enzyme
MINSADVRFELKVAESGGKVIGFVGGRIFDESQSQMDKIFQGMERDTKKVLSDRFPSFIKDMMTMDDYHRKTISRHRRECNGEMELLAVDPAHMGKGIGSRLAGEIFRTLRSKGAVVSFFYINDLCKVSFCLRPCYEKTDETEMTLGKMKVGSYIYSVNLNYFK